jgi:hypothetical protein
VACRIPEHLQRSCADNPAFRRLFSHDPSGSYHLLIKEVDWARYLEATIRSLLPNVVLIIRHSCTVISSVRKGQRLGLMPREDRQDLVARP